MLTPSDLVEIRKIIIAAQLVNSGAFDAELQKIDEAQKQFLELEADARVRAEEIVYKAQAKVEEMLKDVARQQSQLDDRTKELQASKDEFTETRSKAEVEIAAQRQATEKNLFAATDLLIEATSKMNAADERSAALDAQEAAIRAERAALEERLRQFRAIAA